MFFPQPKLLCRKHLHIACGNRVMCSMHHTRIVTFYEVPGGLRRGGLEPACGSAHARKTGNEAAKGSGVVLHQFVVLQV